MFALQKNMWKTIAGVENRFLNLFDWQPDWCNLIFEHAVNFSLINVEMNKNVLILILDNIFLQFAPSHKARK